MIERDIAELLKWRRELRLCNDSGEESAEKEEAHAARSIHLEAHAGERNTRGNAEARSPEDRRGGLCSEE